MNHSISRILLLLIALGSFLGCERENVTRSGNTRSARTLDQTAPELMKRAQVPGMAVAVVEDDTLSTWIGGKADVETSEPVTGATVFEAASLSKPVFAVLVMKLVEMKKLELDTPLGRYMPRPYFADPRAAALTPRMILSHRSGLPNWRPGGGELTLYYEPGTRFSYSGEGYVYLQRAIETVTGESLQSLAAKYIFDPLQMSSSSFVWRDEFANTKAWGHDDAGHKGERRHPPEALSAASLHTTAADMGRFVLGMFRRTVLVDDSVLTMLAPETPVPSNCAVCFPARDPGPDRQDLSWGLGYGLVDDSAHRYFFHWGDNGEFKSYLFGDDVGKRAVVILTNGSSGLSIAGDIASSAMETSLPLVPLEWLSYERWDSPVQVAFHDILTSQGNRLPELDPEVLGEDQINALGYQLIRSDLYAAATRVFLLGTERKPNSSNAWDSLGESFALGGNRKKALESYRKSLEINPESDHAKAMITRLEQGLPIPPEELKAFTGTYDLGDDLAVIRLTPSGLVIDCSTMENATLLPIRQDRFITKNYEVAFEIVRETGRIVRIEGGRVTVGHKR